MEEQLTPQIKIVKLHTNYTTEEAENKLKEMDNDPKKVIRAYLFPTENKSSSPVKSIQQEIYRQYRQNLPTTTIDVEDESKILQNLSEFNS